MSDDDPEYFPPDRQLPVGRRKAPSVPAPVEGAQRLDTGGWISSWLTRLRADSQKQALDSIAARHRSEGDAIQAYGELAESFEKTARTVARVHELPEILALDKAQREAERRAAYAKVQADDDGLNYDRDERAHQARLTALRRERELRDAQRQNLDVERGVFNAEQGLENQRRLKQVNLEIWEKRTDALDAKAERIRDLLRQELTGDAAKGEAGLTEQLEAMRTTLTDQIAELAADGLSDEADRFRRFVDELDQILHSLRET